MTWLYGPLHEHAEPVPPPKIASTQDRLDLDDSIRKKSILKHRTISEMLTTPGRSASPVIEYNPNSADASQENSDTEGERGSRPSFFAVKSDSNLAQRKRKAGGSPPASERLFQNLLSGDKDDGIPHPPPEERRHISFNQRVDQCIAVDIEEHEEEDDEEEDEEEYSDGLYDGDKRDEEEEDTPSSDEEVLTMKSSPRTSSAWPLTSTASSQGSSPSLEHHTIAKLAPTLLKTSDTYPAPSPQVVDPTGFTGRYGDQTIEDSSHAALPNQPPSYQYSVNPQEDEATLPQTRYSQWDADDDFSGDFDYFNGPDMAENYEQSNPVETIGVPKDEVASKKAAQSTSPGADSNTSNDEQASSSHESTSAPRSILKKRNANVTPSEGLLGENGEVVSPNERGPNDGSLSPGMPSSPNPSSSMEGRGRSSQRLGGSASYERLQDASRGSAQAGIAPNANTSHRNRSSSNTSTTSSSPSSSLENTSNLHAGYKPSERRDSFRGKAGDGSKAMGSSGSNSYASAAASSASVGSKKGQGGGSATALDSDSDGRGSFDFNSPGYPASPLLGDKNDQPEGSDNGEAKLYGRKKDASKWADANVSRGKGPAGKKSVRQTGGRSGQDEDDEEPARLSVDLENLPSNMSPTGSSAPGGPTPLNTPTFALAKSRQRQSKSSGSSTSTSGSDKGKGPDSPTLPRRSSATGALVAPSDADKDAGVRVPLAHDYVEEDEGGIVGRAVEIVNTARDLIGALLGTGGDRGRSWRESY